MIFLLKSDHHINFLLPLLSKSTFDNRGYGK